MYESAIKLLRSLASLKLTLVGIITLLAGVLLSYFSEDPATGYLVLPLALLATNLLAAIVFNPRIRQNSGLLMFHICLLMLAVLTLLSELTSMKGRVEVTQGTAFDADSVTVTEQGAWHPLGSLQQVAFVQGGIEVDYAAGLRRGVTRSQLLAGDGNTLVVGDNLPFKSHGYRFYTTSNKGFGAIVNWYGNDGSMHKGAIHFPSYPLYDWKQQNEWQAPSGELLAFRLMIDTPLDRNREWLLQGIDHGELEIILPDGSRRTLTPGDYVELDNGQLEFEALRMWMGYKIFYDPLLAWFLAAALVGVAGLAWHYYLKLASPGKRHLFTADKAGRARVVSTSRRC